ncbi:ABC transporter substrate-binding protein [Limibacter armeniacum]|uniref:ABC transporter substrate-binding protein n=1 Tax=Limibacter armeniacum TaxID=466084 RepID=UPI002FE5A2FD
MKYIKTRSKKAFRPFVGLAICLAFLTNACQQPSDKSQTVQHAASAGITEFTPKQVKYAKGFNLKYYDGYKVLELYNPFNTKADTLKYVLHAKGIELPESVKALPSIEIPVKKIVALSGTHLGMLDLLDATEQVVGISNKAYVCNEKLLSRAQNGSVIEAGYDGSINKELVIASGADLVLTIGMNSDSYNRYPVFEKAGIQTLAIADWKETSPLGRAEWCKFMAAFLNKEEIANKEMAKIEAEWDRLKVLAAEATTSPTLIAEVPYKDAWFIPGGQSFMAELLRAANTNYYWDEDTSTGSLHLNLEYVYPVALEADYWINTGTANSKEELVGFDSRFADFKAVNKGLLFNNNRNIASNGSNAYWETGIVNPHLILADLIKIFHPELMKDHEFVYYKKLK